MSPQIMNSSKGKLIFRALIEFLMILHETFFIIFLMGQMEKQSYLERSLISFLSLSSGVVVLAKGIIAAGFKHMKISIIGFPQQFVIDLNGFAE